MDFVRYKREKVLAAWGMLLFSCQLVASISSGIRMLGRKEEKGRLHRELLCVATVFFGLLACAFFRDIKLLQWARSLGPRSRELHELVQKALRECGHPDEIGPGTADCVRSLRDQPDPILPMKRLSRVYRTKGCEPADSGAVFYFATSIEDGFGVFAGCEEVIATGIRGCRYVEYRKVSENLFVFIATE